MQPLVAPTTHLLYLHGFRSSPQSAKARVMAQVVARDHPGVTWWCPQLPPSPRQAIDMVMQATADWPRDHMAVVGSSLGGFYATWVAEKRACPAVLLNPAVDPSRDLASYIGSQTQFHNPAEEFYFHPDYVQELRDLHAGPLTGAGRYLAIIAKGDEVLDWREMHQRYAQSQQVLLEGGDHVISDFASHLPRVLEFLNLA
jgi:predicted esterase YcpF (UPF0227 family)